MPDETVTAWMRRQFTSDRVVRWMDAANPKHRYGDRSFVQVLEYDYVYNGKKGRGHHVIAPHLWSVILVGVGGGARAAAYMTVYFFAQQGGGYLAKITIWSTGVRYTIPRRKLTGEVVLAARENAPKRLNREARRLRALLFRKEVDMSPIPDDQPKTEIERPPHQQRVIQELRDLNDKIEKLTAFFDNPIFATLDPAEQDRLQRQIVHMRAYAMILVERIAAF